MSDLPGAKMVAAAWKYGFDCLDEVGEVVLAGHNSPPAFTAALLDNKNGFRRADSREDRGRWFSMYAVTGSNRTQRLQ